MEKKQEKYIIELDREEIEEEKVDIQEHPNFKLFLQVDDGRKRYEKLLKLIKITEKKEGKEAEKEKDEKKE